jgi:hypothetical protein
MGKNTKQNEKEMQKLLEYALSNDSIASTASTLFRINKQEKVFLSDVIKTHNRQWFLDDDEALTDKDLERVVKAINEDDLWLADYEVVDNNYIERKKYDPFTCEFKTSGRIVVENDLRKFFKDVDFDINTTKGIIKTMEYYSRRKMLHGFVGNSCPSIYINKELGKINIGAEHDEKYNPIIPDGFELLTSICTDLWWYSIIDVEVLKKLDENFTEEDYNIVEIPSGTWKLSHKYHISEMGYHKNLPYATMELISGKY